MENQIALIVGQNIKKEKVNMWRRKPAQLARKRHYRRLTPALRPSLFKVLWITVIWKVHVAEKEVEFEKLWAILNECFYFYKKKNLKIFVLFYFRNHVRKKKNRTTKRVKRKLKNLKMRAVAVKKWSWQRAQVKTRMSRAMKMTTDVRVVVVHHHVAKEKYFIFVIIIVFFFCFCCY